MSNTITTDITLGQRLNLAYDANARALEVLDALRPYIDQSSAIELPTLLFKRLHQLCHVSYDLTGGGDLDIPGSSIHELRGIVEANALCLSEPT
ncbi:MAG: hypothetical protein QM749_19800 [Aquabacterium sp.]